MEEKKQKKLSYEELEKAAKQISEQAEAVMRENGRLREAIQQANLANMFTQLQFRFEVLKNSEHFSEEFVERTAKEIEETMTPKEEESQEETTKEE